MNSIDTIIKNYKKFKEERTNTLNNINLWGILIKSDTIYFSNTKNKGFIKEINNILEKNNFSNFSSFNQHLKNFNITLNYSNKIFIKFNNSDYIISIENSNNYYSQENSELDLLFIKYSDKIKKIQKIFGFKNDEIRDNITFTRTNDFYFDGNNNVEELDEYLSFFKNKKSKKDNLIFSNNILKNKMFYFDFFKLKNKKLLSDLKINSLKEYLKNKNNIVVRKNNLTSEIKYYKNSYECEYKISFRYVKHNDCCGLNLGYNLNINNIENMKEFDFLYFYFKCLFLNGSRNLHFVLPESSRYKEYLNYFSKSGFLNISEAFKNPNGGNKLYNVVFTYELFYKFLMKMYKKDKNVLIKLIEYGQQINF